MKGAFRIMVPLLVAATFAGCATNPNTPLVFGESLTLGIGIGSSAADQGVDVTLGFKSRDIAVVPVTMVVNVDKDGKAVSEKLSAKLDGTGKSEDAFSVLGQFESTTSGTDRKIGLGKFFATGVAAQLLAEGFRSQMEGDEDSTPEADAEAAKVKADAEAKAARIKSDARAKRAREKAVR